MGITTVSEGRRGCGYRKPGGLYLVTDGAGEYCPLLPHELRVCPCCGEGIKPTRGYTWVDADKLIPPPGQHGPGRHWKRCPLSGGVGRAGLIWIGGRYYSPASFTAEAERMGISRRIPAVPKDFEIGVTYVLFAHREASWEPCKRCGDGPVQKDCPECDGQGFLPVPAIFYLARPQRIEYVVKGDETDEEIERLEERGITPVKIERIEEQEALELD